MARRRNRDWDYLYKILLIGEHRVGKSSLNSRFTTDIFSCQYPTIGCDFMIKTIHLDGKAVKLQIWENYGGERCRFISSTNLRGCHGLVFVYDVTQERSFNEITKWLKVVGGFASDDERKYRVGKMCKLLVGSKCDLTTEKVVDYNTAKKFTEDHGMTLIETSAKNSVNVNLAFVHLTAMMRKSGIHSSK